MAVVGKSEEDLAKRAGYFQEMIALHLGQPQVAGLSLVYHPNVSRVLAEVYFCINNHYKRRFLGTDRRTMPPKIAALTCAAIAAVKPLRPSTAIDKEELLYANSLFAMRCASSIIDHPFDRRAFDERRRFLRSLEGMELPSLKPMLEEARANKGALQSEWDIRFTRDEDAKLQLLVNAFEVFQGQKIYKDQHAGKPGAA